ncbi:hypothetical protein VTH82DRAFT_2924 [Thermothelomyces myriococcoides]
MVQWAQEEDHGHSTSWSDAWPWEQQLVHRARRTYDEMGRELLNTHRECALREPEEPTVQARIKGGTEAFLIHQFSGSDTSQVGTAQQPFQSTGSEWKGDRWASFFSRGTLDRPRAAPAPRNLCTKR